MPEKLSSGPKIGHDLSRDGSGLSRGPNLSKKLVSSPYASGTFPAPGSTLDLDFVNNRGWVRGVGQGGSFYTISAIPRLIIYPYAFSEHILQELTK